MAGGSSCMGLVVTLTSVATPAALSMGDVTGDGRPDLLVTEYPDGGPKVLRQFPDGGFDVPRVVGQATGCRASYAVDFNADSIVDVVSLCNNDVALFPGTDGGTFGSKISNVIAMSTEPYQNALAFGRLDADAFPDFVTVEWPGRLTPLLGSSNGLLTQGMRLTSLADQCSSVILVDLNNDSRLDSVVSTSKSQNRVVDIRYGQPGGGFSSATAFVTDAGADMVASADFNADGWQDLALPRNENNNGISVSVLMNQRDGGFGLGYAQVRNFPRSVATGDFDGDSKVDLAVGLDCGICGIDFVHGNGDGTFAAPSSKLPGVTAKTVIAGDLNGDGVADLATLQNNTITLVLSRAGCPLF